MSLNNGTRGRHRTRVKHVINQGQPYTPQSNGDGSSGGSFGTVFAIALIVALVLIAIFK